MSFASTLSDTLVDASTLEEEIRMKRLKLLALLAVFALFAAACGGSDSDSTDDTASDSDTTEVEANDGADAGDDEAMDDDAGDDPEPADDVEPADDETPASTGSAAGTGGDLDLLQWQAPSSANPLLSGGTKDLLAGSLVVEPLARWNPGGDQLVATLAAEIPSTGNGISEDLTQITWKLRDDILWSDGTPFTADDVLFTYEYCTDEATGCATDEFTNVESVVADDDYTVTVTFSAPQAFPFTPFVGYTNPIIQRAQFTECMGAASTSCTEQNFGPIGTGPYMITDFRAEDTVTYTFNPNFRGNAEGQPFFENVTIKGGGDAEAAARSVLEIGEADYAWNLQVAPEILNPMVEAGLGQLAVTFTSSVEHINLNQTNNRAEGDLESNYADGTNPNPFFFNNGELARALSLAINRDDLVTVGYGAGGKATCNMWHLPGETSTANDACLVQDTDEANSILDGLGYLDTDDDGVRELPDGTPLEFSFATSTNAVRQSNQDLIKDHWQQIGVVANMTNVDASLFFGESTGEQSIWYFPTDIEMFTQNAPGPDAQVWFGYWRTSEIPTPENAFGPSNIPRHASDEYDAVYEQLEVTSVDDPARGELIKQLNDILAAQSGAIIPLVFRGSVSAFANDIQGVGELNGWDSEYWNIQEWTRSE